MAASSLVSSQWTYDVFPSFRGKDVRRSFLSYLLDEFDRKGIITFKDTEMKRSKSISPELVLAIKESRISIIILSKNYASSIWSLNELVEIMECHKASGKMVITIFYEVKPSDVRKQKGEFGKAYKKTCKKKTDEEKQRWNQALTDVSYILGEYSLEWKSEAAMISKIARDISNELNLTASRDFDNLIGIEAHISNMDSLLSIEPDETRMIGIWGPVGIGKTTIARALYNRISRNFTRGIFMDNVKGRYKRNGFDTYFSKLGLQEDFLSEILDHKDMSISHLGTAEERLKFQKVLVVLDDVDKLEQLKALANQPHWFGKGSRIIVTTEDKHILEAHGITLIYEVEFPSRDEALQIFSQSAFTQNVPPKDYEELALEVTELTSHLPLGLCVLGSALRGKSVREWKNELPRLKTSLNGDIEQVLRVGYNSLDDKDKSLFLHIAFSSESERANADTQFFSNSGLTVLVKRALISILSDKSITMHHLLRQMGREIVRRQSIQSREKFQFLMSAHQSYDVLADNTGTGTVLSILFDTSKISQLLLGERTLNGMHDLQFFRFYRNLINKIRQHLPKGLDDLSLLQKLESLLDWDSYPLKAMPSKFLPELVTETETQQSKLEKLWDRTKSLAFYLLTHYAFYMVWLLRYGFFLVRSMFPPTFANSHSGI